MSIHLSALYVLRVLLIRLFHVVSTQLFGQTLKPFMKDAGGELVFRYYPDDPPPIAF